MRCSILQIKHKNNENRYWVSSSPIQTGYIPAHSDAIPSLISPGEYLDVAKWCYDNNFKIINEKEYLHKWPDNDELNRLRKEWFV